MAGYRRCYLCSCHYCYGSVYAPLRKFLKEGGSVVFTPVNAAYQVKSQGDSDIKFAGESETAPSLEEIVNKVQLLESTGGKYDQKCERIGLHNSYGYGQTEKSNLCFKSDKEARKEVVKWFERELKNHSLKASLCRYNLGSYMEDCHYVEMFYNL